jgi:FMN phosphatase YigB (HAD superfamily)
MTAVYLDLDGALVESRPGRYEPEFFARPGVEDGIARLFDIADDVIVLVEPIRRRPGQPRYRDDPRIQCLRDTIGADAERLTYVRCPHGARACDCTKPAPGLISVAREKLDLPADGWHVGGDQEGVQAGRTAGLRTIRVGPTGVDHLSTVHRPDYEARDLLDAANRILIESAQTLGV